MLNSVLINLARYSIQEYMLNKTLIDKIELYEKYPQLCDERATFVTLMLEGRLRGCMGSLLPHRRLLEDVYENAQNAAFRDFRFQPLSVEEFEKVNIEISLLSLPKIVIYESIEELKEKVKPDIHGVILQQDQNKATFLPQVWEELPSFNEFFSHLCLKAGLAEDSLKYFPEIYTYEVEKIK